MSKRVTQIPRYPDTQLPRYSDKQETEGKEGTDNVARRFAAFCGESRHVHKDIQPTRLSILKLCAEAENAAADFAEKIENEEIEEWQLMFRLAKRLRGLTNIEQIELLDLSPVVKVFCKTLSANGIGASIDFSDHAFEDRWLEFLDSWEKVKFPDGKGPLEMAFEQAKKVKIMLRVNLGPDFNLIACTAYCLQQLQGDAPIMLPVEHVGRLLGKDKMHGSRIVQLLTRYGFLEVIDGNYSYKQHQAKKYRFVFNSVSQPGVRRSDDE